MIKMQQSLFINQKKELAKECSPPIKNTYPSNVNAEELADIQKNETFAVAYVRRIAYSTLNEKRTIIEVNLRYSIKPYPQERSTYGGFSGSGHNYTEETLQDIFKDLIEFKENLMNVPYTNELKDAHRYTNLKDSNVLVAITENTKKYIETIAKIKWSDFLDKLNSIKNKTIPEGYNGLVQKECELEKTIEMKEKRISALKEEYIKKLDDRITLMQRNSSMIYNEFKKEKAELAIMKKELEEIRLKIDKYCG